MSTLDKKIEAYIRELGQRAKAAAAGLLKASTDQKNEALRQGAANLRSATDELIAANEKDVLCERGRKAGLLYRSSHAGRWTHRRYGEGAGRHC